MASTNKSGIPPELMEVLAAQDARHNFPAGTMAAILQQEVGGNLNEYIQKPDKYHYGLNAEGRRVAPHTGKISTAFGPFGILESTGADPGWGVKPLQNKTLEEQIRFAADYLAARKGDADLKTGLARYGEGEKYAKAVMARLQAAEPEAPAVAQAPTPAPEATPEVPPTQVAQTQPPSVWDTFSQYFSGDQASPEVPAQRQQLAQLEPTTMQYGPRPIQPVAAPQYSGLLPSIVQGIEALGRGVKNTPGAVIDTLRGWGE